jgi:hypothetical protein
MLAIEDRNSTGPTEVDVKVDQPAAPGRDDDNSDAEIAVAAASSTAPSHAPSLALIGVGTDAGGASRLILLARPRLPMVQVSIGLTLSSIQYLGTIDVTRSSQT